MPGSNPPQSQLDHPRGERTVANVMKAMPLNLPVSGKRMRSSDSISPQYVQYSRTSSSCQFRHTTDAYFNVAQTISKAGC